MSCSINILRTNLYQTVFAEIDFRIKSEYIFDDSAQSVGQYQILGQILKRCLSVSQTEKKSSTMSMNEKGVKKTNIE